MEPDIKAFMRSSFFLAFIAAVVCGCSSSKASTSDGDVLQSDNELERSIAASPVLRDAVKAIDEGHPWKATQLAAPLAAKSPGNRAAVLVAARAAAEWEGWTEVERLLGKQRWLDSAFTGEGHELLARAALASNAADSAIRHAADAVRQAPDAASKAIRQVYLARALDRGIEPDSAAAVYSSAARRLPLVAEWLALRAAGAERDADARTRLYGQVKSEIVKTRVPWTEAQARERFGDLAGAADRFAALGARVSALRLHMAMTSDSSASARIKDSLVAILHGQPSRDDARQIVQILDKSPGLIAPADELEIGRALSGIGPVARAVTGFDRANRARLLKPEDRLQFALALSRSNRTRDALAQLDSITAPASLAGQAAYQRARLTASSNAPAAIAALRAVADRFATDADAAASALYLFADLSTDAGNDDAAIAAYRELYTKYPRSPRADDARFRAAILDFAHDRAKQAAIEFDSIVTLMPSSGEGIAARYWSGRAWKAAGDSKRSSASWTAVLNEQPSTYYGQAAARRLGRPEWTPSKSADRFTPAPGVDSAFKRIRLLERLGMDAEARFELDALEERAATTKDLAPTIAAAFREYGDAPRTIRIANKLVDQGSRDASIYRLAYPLVDRDELVQQSHAQHLDPALVAGLIRQESSFDPHATSVANARGLMQVLPTVGADIARALRFPVWSPALLYDADANLQLGTAHLSAATKQYADMPRILAAYNAGDTRVERWQKKTGASDPEVFAEEIPFVETRDYVRVVQRNREMYRVLYGLK
jgi:soluble lytic murein transglycosylase